MKTVLEILKGALRRIEDPAHWTQRQYAASDTGNTVYPNSPNAVCWCAGGAILAEIGATGFAEVPNNSPAVYAACAVAGSRMHLWIANDEGTHESIVALFRNTIAKLEEAEASS